MLLRPPFFFLLYLRQMVESVLNMADYSTFSAMMRVRAAQMRKLRDAEAIAKKRHEEIRARARLLASSQTTPEQFVELFDSMRERICNLTPKRDDLRVRCTIYLPPARPLDKIDAMRFRICSTETGR